MLCDSKLRHSILQKIKAYSTKMNSSKKAACCLIMTDDFKILSVKRKDGKWGFPGGKVDEGENEFQACYRELKEETGIDFKKQLNMQYSRMLCEQQQGDFYVYCLGIKITGNKKLKTRSEKPDGEVKWLTFEQFFANAAFPEFTGVSVANALKYQLVSTKIAKEAEEEGDY